MVPLTSRSCNQMMHCSTGCLCRRTRIPKSIERRLRRVAQDGRRTLSLIVSTFGDPHQIRWSELRQPLTMNKYPESIVIWYLPLSRQVKCRDLKRQDLSTPCAPKSESRGTAAGNHRGNTSTTRGGNYRRQYEVKYSCQLHGERRATTPTEDAQRIVRAHPPSGTGGMFVAC